MIDDEDFELCSHFRWYLTPDGYVQSSRGVILARLIMKAPKGLYVDHKNRKKLDNRITNLRICTGSQNQINSRPGSKGFYKEYGKWRVRVGLNNKRIHVGYFKFKKDAIAAYNKKAKELYGDFLLPASLRA